MADMIIVAIRQISGKAMKLARNFSGFGVVGFWDVWFISGILPESGLG
ncbi:hypothetical protein [Dehalogenimonas etheniformans]|nr:hypothetical protein [Dehalogenimonas etheniformans]